MNNWTKVKGNHTMKWGTDIRYANNIRVPSDIHRSGTIKFNDAVTGDANVAGSGLAPASFLLGLPNFFQRFAENATDPHDYQYRMFYFVQDTWRATTKLTVSYGLRWDTWFPDSSVHAGQGGRFDVTTVWCTCPALAVSQNRAGSKRSGTISHRAWRIAYNVTPKTVIRTGWGRSYFQGIFGWTFNNLTLGFPTLIQQAIPGANAFSSPFSITVGPPLPVFPTIPCNGLMPLPDQISSGYVPANLKYPYVDAWNLSVARQLTENMVLEMAYVGNVGRNLNYGYNLNAAIPGPGDFNPRRPLWAKYGLSQGIGDTCDCASSSYNALQVKGIKRFTKNYSFNANFTWARAMDFGEFGVVTNAYKYADDHGPADFDRATVFNISHEVILPFGPGQRWASNAHGVWRQVIEGWQWTGGTSLLSGYPFSPVLYNNSSLNSDMSMRPDITGDPSVSNPNAEWLVQPRGLYRTGAIQVRQCLP